MWQHPEIIILPFSTSPRMFHESAYPYLSPPQFFLPPWGVIFPRACSGRKEKKKRQAYKCTLCRNSTPSHSFNSSVFLVLHSCYLTTPLLPLEDLTKLGTCWTGSLQPFLAHRHWGTDAALPYLSQFSDSVFPLLPGLLILPDSDIYFSPCTKQRPQQFVNVFWTRFSFQATWFASGALTTHPAAAPWPRLWVTC